MRIAATVFALERNQEMIGAKSNCNFSQINKSSPLVKRLGGKDDIRWRIAQLS